MKFENWIHVVFVVVDFAFLCREGCRNCPKFFRQKLSRTCSISRVGNSCLVIQLCLHKPCSQSFHCFAGAVIGGQLKQFETCSSLDVHFTVLDLMSTVLIVTSLMSLACSWTHVDSLDSVATVFQLSWFCSSTCRQFLLLCFGMVLQCVVLDLNVL